MNLVKSENLQILDRWQKHDYCASNKTQTNIYAGAKSLFHCAWVEFAARLEPEAEITLLLDLLSGRQEILDIGGGTGLLTTEIAKRYGKCTVVEPDADNAAQIKTDCPIDIVLGSGENLPFADRTFDGALATWVLQYSNNPAQCITEMVRVCQQKPEATIILIQAAPWNQVAQLLNDCAGLVGKPLTDHGYLLALAASILEQQDFAKIEMHPVKIPLNFPESTPELRTHAAKSLLQRMCFEGHPRRTEIQDLLADKLKSHFQSSSAINDDGIVLVAKYSGAD